MKNSPFNKIVIIFIFILYIEVIKISIINLYMVYMGKWLKVEKILGIKINLEKIGKIPCKKVLGIVY